MTAALNQIALCPHCWCRYNEALSVCAVTHNIHKCSGCYRRFGEPLVVTPDQADAIDAAVEEYAREQLGRHYEPSSIAGTAGSHYREQLRQTGWIFPDEAGSVE